MKILIYTPIDETFEFTHAKLVSELKGLDDTDWMSPVLFAHYLRTVGLSGSVEDSIFKAIKSTNDYILEREQLGGNMIVIGNCSRAYKFDLIIGHTQNLDFKPQPELLLDKMRRKYGDEPMLAALLNNMYQEKDCESFLIDATETMKFVKKVIEENDRRTK